MPKPKEEEEPKEWDPSQPLDDEDEEDVQVTFRKQLRLAHLKEEAEKKKKPAKKKSSWIG
jgi:hypothetical protein